MEHTSLGRTGLQVSRICLGCMSYGSAKWRDWVLDYDAALPFFKQAHEAGINFYDTADMYSDGASEEVLGRTLKELAVPREQVVIASKLFNPTGKTPNERGTARKHVRHAIENTLRRLGTDYVDLYQIHRYDRTTPVEETLDALGQLVDEGKVLYLGASSMAAWEFAKFLYKADSGGFHRFVCMQNHYNLVYREEEREMIPLCREEGVGIIPWSPLARGFLAGNRDKATRGETTRAKSDDFAHKMYYEDSDFTVVDRVAEVAKEVGVAPAQVALAWMLHKPGITAPIIGATKAHHLDDAFKALEIKLSPEQILRLEEPYRPHPVLGFS